jgi:hypothetical protein
VWLTAASVSGAGVVRANGDPFSDADEAALLAAAAAAGVEVHGLDAGRAGRAGGLGALLSVRADLGRCKLAPRRLDPSGVYHARDSTFCDHAGLWHAAEGFDALYLRDGSQPASATAEWCVADPRRLAVTHVWLVGADVPDVAALLRLAQAAAEPRS